MQWPNSHSDNEQQITLRIIWSLWGASFLLVGLMFYRAAQGFQPEEAPILFGPFVILLVCSISSIASWLMNQIRPELPLEQEIGRCLLAFGPGLMLAPVVIPADSNLSLSLVLLIFVATAAILYLQPAQDFETEEMDSEAVPEISMLDYATQLRQMHLDQAVEMDLDAPTGTNLPGESESPVMLPEETEPDCSDVEAHPCDLFGSHSEYVTQEFRRTKTPEGAEAFEGFVKIEWAPGQRTAVLNIPFSPPFPECPEIYCEPDDGCPSRTKVADCRSYGTRIEVRLPQECEDHNYSYVHILACLNVDEQEESLSA